MIPGGIIPLWGARSSRNRGAASFRYEGRHHPGIEGRLPQESASSLSGLDRGVLEQVRSLDAEGGLSLG
jgi:hypothetical protein